MRPRGPSDRRPSPFSGPSPSPEAERARALSLGAEAAGKLAGSLIQHLTAALEEGGPVGAIEFCSLRALPLREEVNQSLQGLEVKRTSLRIRNPANRPDSLEAVALTYFEARAAEGDLPPPGLQDPGDGTLRFSTSLVANEMCVQCHGDPAILAPDVAEALAERYPADQATGYKLGDLRGVIRVTIPREGDR